MTTGERIRNARKAAGLTQRELGQKLGLSYQAIAQWENNLRKPKPKTLNRLADALGVSVISLVDSTEYFDVEITEEFDGAIVRMIRRMAQMSGFSSTEEFYTSLLGGETSLAILSTELQKRLITAFMQLNQAGKEKAVERVEELREVLKYQEEPYTYYYKYADNAEKKTIILTIPDKNDTEPPQEE